jgi:hypothetical protein
VATAPIAPSDGIADRYRVLSTIGGGGIGRVHDAVTTRRHTLKLVSLPSHDDGGLTRCFICETTLDALWTRV